MKALNINFWLIHLFAALHAVVALGCRLAGIADDLMLTILTMVMVVFICLNRQMSERFMALSAILVNAIGFGLGLVTSKLLSLLGLPALAVFPISTLLSTEIIGWSLEGIAAGYKEGHLSNSRITANSRRWLMAAFVLVIVFRLTILILKSDTSNVKNLLTGIVIDYFFSLIAIIVVAEYAVRVAEKAERETEKANLAQYRYMKLKHQMNPHFLFNSLNILDCLIQEQSPEQASLYTHKLAEIYRYILSNEEETLVSLREELTFAELYSDLLRLRFPEGLEITVDIPDELMSRKVVPCCLQLLLENAIKHNAARADKPLKIKIRNNYDSSITVSNSLCPKITSSKSTGMGLKYIHQQYSDISGKEVLINRSDSEYSVTLPLL